MLAPIVSPAIDDGGLWIRDGRIICVGRWVDIQPLIPFGAEVLDLGERVVMPGFVDPHCHLDYTCMAGQLVPTRSFSGWIKTIMALKGGLIYADFASSWVSGSKMLLESGVTTVGDVETVPELLPEVWDATPLRVVSFLEMTGVKSQRDPGQILGENLAHLDRLSHPKCFAGLSPHAPYSTSPSLLRLTAEAARDRQILLTMHLSESAEEFEMFQNGTGQMFHWLGRNSRDNSDCGGRSPVRVVAESGLLGPNLLAIHLNYLADGDEDLLARGKVHVVHCPRSHGFFGHDPFPFQRLQNSGVNLCLGTDSLATVCKEGRDIPRLDMFRELKAFAVSHSEVSPAVILEMATINGARALGISAGKLEKESHADLFAVPYSGSAQDISSAIVHFEGRPDWVLAGGYWAVRPDLIHSN